jgi:DNA-binding MurR/RpiR family transcriptional regulator
VKDLEKKIKSFHNNLSPKLKLASVSILRELNQIPFQTIRDTAKKANVSVLTIFRLSIRCKEEVLHTKKQF